MMNKDPFLAYLYQQTSLDSSHIHPKQIERINDILKILLINKINREVLESQCFQGIPDECSGLRPLCWKILLRHLPEFPHMWKASLDASRKQYENHIQNHVIPRHNMVNPTKKIETKTGFRSSRSHSETTLPGQEETKQTDKDKGNDPLDPKTSNTSKNRFSLMDSGDHPLSTAKDSKWNSFFKDQRLMDDIIKDTKRTRTNTEFFQGYTDYPLQTIYTRETINEPIDKETHIDVISRILFIYGKINPGIGYMQGMNEVLAPIYYCFYHDTNPMFVGRAEADSFHCFSKLMKDIEDGFMKKLGDTEEGIQNRIKILNETLKKVDKQLWSHLEKHKVNPQFYSLKWLMLLLAQEFSIQDVLRVWDRLLSHPRKLEYLNYLCLAMMENVRETLMKAEDFATIMEVLQKDTNNDLEKIFATGFRLYKQYVKPEDAAHHIVLPIINVEKETK